MVAVSTPRVLTHDELRRFTPSVFAAHPWERMSSRYRHVPTIEVVDILEDRGFFPVRAAQSRTRIEGKEAFTRHAIRFRHQDHLGPVTVGEEVPELVLTNSHDGSSAYQFHLGLWRLVCSNGLCVASADFGGISVRHSGGSDFTDRILDASFRIVEDTPKTLATVEAWKGIELSPPEQTAFASAAVELIEKPAIQPAQLLAPHRREDAKPDLWTTYNRIQENVIQGGVTARNERNRRTTTRPVKAVDRDIKLNKALWRLTEEMAKMVG